MNTYNQWTCAYNAHADLHPQIARGFLRGNDTMLGEWRLFGLGWIMGRLLRPGRRPQADPERSSRQVDTRRCKDDVDIGRSARGLKLCPAQSFVTMAHWARDLTPRDPT